MNMKDTGRCSELQKQLRVIWEYETSIRRPLRDSIAISKSDDISRLQPANGMSKVFIREYAEKCREYLRFGNEVDDSLNGAREPFDQLKMADTTDLLLRIGFDDKPMLYTQSHLADAIKPKQRHRSRYHGLTIEKIKELPELLESPVLISDNPSNENAIIVVLASTDSDGLPMIASIQPDGLGSYECSEILTNIVLTVFGKDNFENYFRDVLTPDKVIYFDNERGKRLERLSEGFSNAIYSSLLPNEILRCPRCLSKESLTEIQKRVVERLGPSIIKARDYHFTKPIEDHNL